MLPWRVIQQNSIALTLSLVISGCATPLSQDVDNKHQSKLQAVDTTQISGVTKKEGVNKEAPKDQEFLFWIGEGSRGKQVIVPVHLESGKFVGEFVLGESTWEDIKEKLPPYPWSLPSRPQINIPSWLPDDLRRKYEDLEYDLKDIKYQFPAGSQVFLGFNRQKRLTSIAFYLSSLPEAEAESISRKLDSMLELEELHRYIKTNPYVNVDEGYGSFVKQGKLTDCVNIHAQYDFLWGTIGGADEEKMRACNNDVHASKYEKGIACLKEVLTEAPESGRAHYSLGLAYVWSNNEQDAKKELETLKRLKEVGLAKNLLGKR